MNYVATGIIGFSGRDAVSDLLHRPGNRILMTVDAVFVGESREMRGATVGCYPGLLKESIYNINTMGPHKCGLYDPDALLPDYKKHESTINKSKNNHNTAEPITNNPRLTSIECFPNMLRSKQYRKSTSKQSTNNAQTGSQTAGYLSPLESSTHLR